MTKVYGKRSGRAMRAIAHGLLLVAIALPLVGAPCLERTARADGLMLLDEPSPPKHGYGWLFIGLTLISYGVAANDYQESQYNITKAKKAYKNYLAATTASDALSFREQTTTYSNRAQSYESTTNAALILGSLFALSAIAIFRTSDSDAPDSVPILLSDRGVTFNMKF